jgi:restriction system protein
LPMEILGVLVLIAVIVALAATLWPARHERDRIEPEPTWSLDLLRALEWKRFERVCAAYFEAQGLRIKVAREGADGGVDIHLYRGDTEKPTAIAQCKAWNTYKVGIKPVRELYGVMAREGVTKGVFLTTGRFTKEAQAFPKGDDLYLWDGEQIVAKLWALPAEKQAELLRLATEGDFTTPTCPSCGIKMVERTARNTGDVFWGCRNYPRCRQTFKMRD